MVPRSLYNNRPRILLADDHLLIAGAVKNLREPEFKVVGIVSDGGQLLTSIDALQPDVIILDISMPVLNGLDAGEQIKAQKPKIKLIYLTMTVSAEIAAEAFRRGASGYVLKQDAVADVRIAVRRAIRGQTHVSPGIDRDQFEYLLRLGKNCNISRQLTPRQREIMQLLAEGMSLKQIGSVLNIAPGTVAFHKHRAMALLGIKTSAGLLHYTLTHLPPNPSASPRTTPTP